MTNGENIIYHYIQNTLLTDDKSDDFSRELIERLIIDLSIWIPANVYKEIPILIPYVIRDNKCRIKTINSTKDEWGSSNKKGLLRDDNSLIKGIIKSFLVIGNSVKDYNNKKLANGFVASHIWRKLIINKDNLASTYEKTNSFIPNLVWLPKQVSKLTDREDSYAQRLLKTISYKIYYNKLVSPFKQDIWKELDNPDILTKTNIVVDKLNYFNIPQKWISKKKTELLNEMETIKRVLQNGLMLDDKVKCSSYLPSLVTNIDDTEKEYFIDWLNSNINEIKNNIN